MEQEIRRAHKAETKKSLPHPRKFHLRSPVLLFNCSSVLGAAAACSDFTRSRHRRPLGTVYCSTAPLSTCSRRSRRLRHDRSISAWLRLLGGSTKPGLRFDRGKYRRRQWAIHGRRPAQFLRHRPRICSGMCGAARDNPPTKPNVQRQLHHIARRFRRNIQNALRPDHRPGKPERLIPDFFARRRKNRAERGES